MRYAKPEITSVCAAVTSVCGSPSKVGMNPDGDGGFITSPAYEADE
jgi:hypothetical protein